MFTSLAIVSLLTSAAVAQSTSNPLIPSGISSGCSSFLNNINNDSGIKQCTQSLMDDTAGYAPGGNTTTPTLAGMTSTLDKLCSGTNTACSEQAIRQALSDFYTQCSAELVGDQRNTQVITIYDTLYTIIPMKQAVCGKDDSGRYCVTKSASVVGGSSASPSGVKTNLADSNSWVGTIQNYLWSTSPTALSKRADAMFLNVTTYTERNIPFMFLTPDLDYNTLCTACTRSTLTPYINFQSNTPYAPGLNNSVLLKRETELYQGIQKTCGPNFLSQVVQAAGGLSDGSSNGSFKVEVGLVTIFISVITMAVASAL
ncbi:hypothetical protein VNI00_007666 [Paramarasmius palmivorus]|uniref:DUF7729 domain-containing protein n=1 Tax=Paramarasmius palmivorus TaxID=297713 RepID=A0AAW0CZS8_9AGAR